jgi:hypothetical protein
MTPLGAGPLAPYGAPPQGPPAYGPPVQTQVLLPVHRCSTAHVVVAWVLAVLTGFYLLPWAVAATRGRRNVAAVALVDLLLGWTLVGWVVALVMACGADRPVVLVQHTYAPWGPPPAPATAPPVVAPEPTVVDPLGTAVTEVLPFAPARSTHQR